MKKLLILLTAVLLITMSTLTACSKATSVKLKMIDIDLTSEQYAYLINKENTQLQASFNSFLEDIKEDGTFDAITAKYFNGEGQKVGYDTATTDVTNTDDNFVVVTNCPFSPFEYISADDAKIYGIDIEIAGKYAEANNLTLVIKNLSDFDTIFPQVENGLADIAMAGITVSEDRKDLYLFTTEYYNASQKIIVAEDNTDFDNCKTSEDVEAVINSLSKKSIGYQNGTTGNWYVAGDEDWGYTGFSNVTTKGYDTALLACSDIINGNLYAVVVDSLPGESMVEALNA